MLIYWSIFFFISILATNQFKIEKNLYAISKFLFLFVLSVFIGLRHEVGGDWDIYLNDFEFNIQFFNIKNFSYVRDFGYELFSYICFNLGIGIYGLNFILSILFIYSLNKFANLFKDNYWLIILISFPYLIVVVSMGYTRQATAVSLVLLSICSLSNNKLYSFIFYAFVAILFHKSSIIMIPLIFITHLKLNYINILLFIILAIFSSLIIYPEFARISSGYLSEQSKYISKGVYYRIFLNILAGILFLIFYKYLKINKRLDRLIILIFIINLLLLFTIQNYSTLVDRIIIYFTFIQLIVFSRLYLIKKNYKIFFNLFVISIYFCVFLVWLHFSIHSYAWIPYKNILIEIYS